MTSESGPAQTSCGLVESLIRFGWRLFLKTSVTGRRLRSELDSLSLFVETSILQKALGDDLPEVLLTVEGADADIHLATHVTDRPEKLEHTRHLATLMRQVGVERIRLDTRLEANQFADIAEMLWGLRQRLERRAADHEYADSAIADLVSRPGKRIACTITFLDTDARTLFIRYSYCELVFSRAVKTFKERTSNLFKDHRAFFRAAPRFAFVALILAGMPYMVLAFTPGLGVLGYALILAAAVATCGTISFLTYLIFQTIGSIEYDKEQQAWELEQAYNEISCVHRNLQADLDAARVVQRKLMPASDAAPFPDHVAIATSFRPEMQIGGDYFDFKALDDSLLAIIIADVSGHGMSAAFITGLIKTTFELSGQKRRSPSVFVADLNRRLCEMTPVGSFATLVYGVYDVRSHELRYCSAGHSPHAVVVHRASRTARLLSDSTSMIAGVVPDVAYRDGLVRLEPGDKLVLATDGVTEARDPDTDDLFGMQRYQEVLQKCADDGAPDMRDRLLKEVEHFEAGVSPADDLAILVMEVLR